MTSDLIMAFFVSIAMLCMSACYCYWIYLNWRVSVLLSSSMGGGEMTAAGNVTWARHFCFNPSPKTRLAHWLEQIRSETS